MSEYLETQRKTKALEIPRLPLEGDYYITYRCNNNCRHCWLRIPPNSDEKLGELNLEEIKRIVDEARRMGCRKWHISGGEPMLRPDFSEIFDYITRGSVSYILNTNGTLITPEIALLLKRKGTKMVSLYGATAEVCDHITRNPGSFEATIRGMNYLKEAGVEFYVQITPMRDNYHQIDDMRRLAESLSSKIRYGAEWLHLSARRDAKRNNDIVCQRLDAKQLIEIIEPDVAYSEWANKGGIHDYPHEEGEDRVFIPCVDGSRKFYIDPCGNLTFCGFIRDSKLLYNLRKGSFREGWEEFITSLPDKVRYNREYMENCGSCEMREECKWCPAFAYLEHGRYSAKVEYLCDMAKVHREFGEAWRNTHRRYYQIGGLTIQVNSDLPIADDTFTQEIEKFRVEDPIEDAIKVHYHFALPDLSLLDHAKQVFRTLPWAVYRKDDSWIYVCLRSYHGKETIYQVGAFNDDNTSGHIYSPDSAKYSEGNLKSLFFSFGDQILLAHILADKKGFLLHSSGVILDGKGLAFVGHPESGKSTVAEMLSCHGEILSDERIIIRKCSEGFRIYGTWFHSDGFDDVSPNSAPLKAIIMLKKSQHNRLIALNDRKEMVKKLLAYIIKPFETADWWDKTLSLAIETAEEIPFYVLEFDLSGQAVDLVKNLCGD